MPLKPKKLRKINRPGNEKFNPEVHIEDRANPNDQWVGRRKPFEHSHWIAGGTDIKIIRHKAGEFPADLAGRDIFYGERKGEANKDDGKRKGPVNSTQMGEGSLNIRKTSRREKRHDGSKYPA
ncbi:MAG: hypothetical protein ABID38_05905 [Candidatus Diapherotrites archaeon]